MIALLLDSCSMERPLTWPLLWRRRKSGDSEKRVTAITAWGSIFTKKTKTTGLESRKRNRTEWLDVRENSKRLVVNVKKEPTEWHALVGKVLKRMSRENHEFKDSLSYNFVLAMKAHVYNTCTWKVGATWVVEWDSVSKKPSISWLGLKPILGERTHAWYL